VAGKIIAADEGVLAQLIFDGLHNATHYYERQKDYCDELTHYERLFAEGFGALPSENIKSGGYVVDTLEAALWCLLNTDDYKSAVLKAVNLGGDTDTVAAVAGGLAGIYYGYDSIPAAWLRQFPRVD
jgi:ADP-ribosylglycohydrolase